MVINNPALEPGFLLCVNNLFLKGTKGLFRFSILEIIYLIR